MKSVLVVSLLALSLACSERGKEIDTFQGRLRCGMTLDQIVDLALTYEFDVREAHIGDHFTHVVRAEGRLDQLNLLMVDNELQSAQAFHHTGPSRLCEYPEILLCAPGQRLRLTIQHSRELEGAPLLIDGQSRGQLQGGAVDVYLIPGQHSIEVRSEGGRRLIQNASIELPRKCLVENPRVYFSP